MSDPYFDYVAFLMYGEGADGSTTFTDRSQYGRTATAVGSAQMDTDISVGGTPSILLGADGTHVRRTYGPELNITGATGPDFCMEAYVRITNLSLNQNQIFGRRRNSDNYLMAVDATNLVFTTYSGTSGTVRLSVAHGMSNNTVYHVCVIRVGTTYYGFVDGVLKGSNTQASSAGISTTDLYLGESEDNQTGRYFAGSINWARITIGVSRYSTSGFTPPSTPLATTRGTPVAQPSATYSNVQLLAGLNGADGATSYTEETSNARAATFFGNAQLDTAQAKFGTASLLLDGTGDYVSFPHASALSIPTGTAGTDAFCVEAWVRIPSVKTGNAVIASKRDASTGGEFVLRLATGIPELLILNGTTAALTINDRSALSVDTWHHIAASATGPLYRLFVNGTMVAFGVRSATPTTNTAALLLGRDASNTALDFNGWIDEFRFTKGQAVYTESFELSDAPFPRGNYSIYAVSASESVSASDTTTLNTRWMASLSETTSMSLDGSEYMPLVDVLSESVTITDALPEDSAVEVTLTETASMSSVIYPGFPVSASETVELQYAAAGARVQFESLIESLTAEVQALQLARSASVSETFRTVDEEPTVDRAFVRTITETAEITETTTALVGVLVREYLISSGAAIPSLTYLQSLLETTSLRDTLLRIMPIDLLESIELSVVLDALSVVVLVERLGLTDALAGAAIYARGWADTVRMSDSLLRFFGGDITESLELTDTLANQLYAIASLTESVEIEPAVSPTWLLRVDVDESVELTAEEVVSMLFQPELLEDVQIEAGYIAPNGSFTTWAMNARTAAVTEYRNYEFNSFAKLGDRYVAASADGLYELLGDDDDGDDIIARLVGGFMQFGGTKLSRLSAAYIAARGEGTFVLKIETADGEVYNYSVDTRDMRSTKFHMGKGQRARYFAFELISAGQDFDLDTLEFVPVVVQRRV